MGQIPLAVRLSDHAEFDNYVAGPNAAALAAVARLASEPDAPALWVWGAPSTGKTHLLQAACAAAGRAGLAAAYLPLATWKDAGPGVLEGWDSETLLCVDDVDAVAGDAAWEAALFTLFNAVTARRGTLLFSASAAPGTGGFTLPDLVSRLSSGAVFRLEVLDEDERMRALALRCRRRGLELPDKTALWLTRHYRRDLGSLFELLERLDEESMVAKRPLTVHFVRGVLNRSGAADAENERSEHRE
ncbi:MAG: DnaA regulatory inactivator Hda [Pseudomonadota bacterium]